MNKKACILGATGLVGSGKELWTKYYWKTRVAQINECKIGSTVICFNDNIDDNGVYKAPEGKDSARNSLWFMAVGCTSDSRNMFGDSIANTVTNKAFDSMTSEATEESKTSSKKSKATADFIFTVN